MTDTIEVRQENPEETENMAKLEEPDNDVYGYLSRGAADQLGEYISLTLSEEADVEAQFDGVTGSGTGNYARFETPGGAVTGLGIHNDVWSSVLGVEVERDDDGEVTNAPESIGLSLRSSDEESYEEAQTADEDEVAALIGGGDDSEEEDEVEEVGVADEEIGLIE